MASLGFNFTIPYVGAGESTALDAYLEKVSDAGLGLWLEVPRAIVLNGGQPLTDYVTRYRDYAPLVGWYLFDEPEWKRASRPAPLKKASDVIRALDPDHPVSLVFMFQGLAAPYRDAMDSFWYDNYPIAVGSREFAAFSGGRYADRLMAAGNKAETWGKQLVLVLQGFGEGEDGKPQFTRRLPTRRETRYCFYAALLACPDSIAYWAWYRGKKEWIEGVLAPLVREFRDRFPHGLSYRSAEGLKIVGGSIDATVLGNNEGRLWLLVLGRDSRNRPSTITLPEGWSFTGRGRSEEIVPGPYGSLFLELTPPPAAP